MKYGNVYMVLIVMCCCLAACGKKAMLEPIPVESVSTGTTLSNQKVKAFAEDSLGYIWIGTDRGLNRYNGQVYRQYFSNPDDSLSLVSNTINCLMYDKENRLWVGTINGVSLYLGEDRFKALPLNTRFKNVVQLLETPDGRILINLIEHLCEYVPQTGEMRVLIEDFGLDNAYANWCRIDSVGRLWSQTEHHLRCFDLNTLEMVQMEVCDENVATNDSVSFIDSRSDQWTATSNKGYVHRHEGQGRFDGMTALKEQLKGQAVTVLSGNRQAWICTDENRVYMTDGKLATEVNTSALTASDGQLMVFADRQRQLWALCDGVLRQCEYSDGRLTVKQVHNEIGDAVLCLHRAADGTVWVGTNANRLYRLKPGDKRFERLDFDAPQMFITYRLCALKNGCLVLGTALNNPIYLNPETHEQRRIPIAQDISDYDLTTAITEDAEENVWIGTLGIGAYRYDPASDEATRINGLPSEEIADIVIDDEGGVWVSTLNGLSRVNARYLTVTNYTAADGIGGNQFNLTAGTRLADGQLLFGGMHGLTSVNPGAKLEALYAPLYFEQLKVNNQLVRLNPTATLTLTHRENNLAVSFAFLDYNRQEQTHHFYRLEGFNDEWIDIGHNREIFISNIPAGHYTLHVRVTDHDQQKLLAENSMDIHIAAAWWNSLWAWLCYIVLAVSYLVVLVLYRRNRRRIREILSQATKVDEKAEKVLNADDKRFMDELYALMEAELSNQELNINSLTEKMLISRSKLNYKVKELTGETPAAFFKRFKLNKAAEILRSGEHTVTEVADLTGFSSPTVFSRNFKQQFGVTPSEYL